jgi:septal ring factor EnvC (AmiA/AmiB activator)
VIKQELALTQTKLSSAEKKIDDLQNLIKRLEADKCRLQKNNLSKVDRLQHLE